MKTLDIHLRLLLAETQANYSRVIDNDQLEDWPEFFEERCLYRITTAENFREGLPFSLVYADSKGMLQDRVAALRDANIYEQQSYRHVLGTACTQDVQGDTFRSETSFMVARIMRTGDTTLFATGRYVDAYRLVSDKLLLTERVVVCDSNTIDTLLALPL